VNRGRRAEKVFIDPNDYRTFVDLLKETADTPTFFLLQGNEFFDILL